MTLGARYEVERTLGRGGMATVYLARDTVLGRHVALKVLAEQLAQDETFRARFLREARLAARVVHQNVVQVYDVGEDESGLGLFITMEYVEGETLADEVSRRSALPAADVVEVGVQLCCALDAAHAAGLVHRDVKPQNILRGRDGTVKLGDFGIARSHDLTALTQHGSILGTAAYLAPEQARGEPVTGATDLYALGVVLYEALAGRRPYDGATLSELMRRRELEPVRPPSAFATEVPRELDTAILRCLALRPDERPRSAAALAAELSRAVPAASMPMLHGTLTTEIATGPTAAAATRRRRSGSQRVLAPAVSILAALALGLAFLAINGSGSGVEQQRATPPANAKPITQVSRAPVVQSDSAAPVSVDSGSALPSPCASLDSRDDRQEEKEGGKKGKGSHRASDRPKHGHNPKHARESEREDCD